MDQGVWESRGFWAKGVPLVGVWLQAHLVTQPARRRLLPLVCQGQGCSEGCRHEPDAGCILGRRWGVGYGPRADALKEVFRDLAPESRVCDLHAHPGRGGHTSHGTDGPAGLSDKVSVTRAPALPLTSQDEALS